jgi:glycine/D-amino acid oxidase-like deaminating enzyme
VIQKQLDKGMTLHTCTPVVSLEQHSSSSSTTVVTSRGDINANAVIIASNGYTAGILPEFKDRIIPVRGTACSITPPSSHSLGSSPGPLKYTYGLRFRQGEMDYMIPRQGRGKIPGVGDRSIILGGAKGCYLKDIESWYDNIHDDEEMPGAREYFQGYMRKHFVGWERDDDKGNVDQVWSGGEWQPIARRSERGDLSESEG